MFIHSRYVRLGSFTVLLTSLPASIMSSQSESPASVHMQPLHNPQNAAQVSIPQAPLGNATNGPIVHGPGMGARAFLAKRIAKTQ